MEVGEAYISERRNSVIIRINRSDNFRVEFYSIPISDLKKLLEEENHKAPVFRVRRRQRC